MHNENDLLYLFMYNNNTAKNVISYDAVYTIINCAYSDISRKGHIQLLLDEDMVDPWGMVADGRMDIRLSRALWKQLRSKFPECVVVIENVETFMKKAEERIFNTSRVVAGWFEEYVSQTSAS